MSLPTGEITFFMTDIEDSSTLWDAAPEPMEAALQYHDALAAQHIAAHGGHLLKSRGEGDSLFAVFARATDAVAAACSLQMAFVLSGWPVETPLRVRIALHTGPATLSGNDYHGLTISRCARMRAKAYGEQVLFSETTYAQAAHTLPELATCRDLGLHTLKGIRNPERLFQLLHPMLPANFPPPGSGQARRYKPFDWAFAQLGQGVILLQAGRNPVVLEYNHFLHLIASEFIHPEDVVVGGVFTDGMTKRVGDLRVYDMVRTGGLRTDDLPVETPFGILAVGEEARVILRATKEKVPLLSQTLVRASERPQIVVQELLHPAQPQAEGETASLPRPAVPPLPKPSGA